MKKKLLALLIAVLVLIALTGCDSSDYKNAVSLYEAGQYSEAAAKFTVLGDYENSQAMVLVCQYEEAGELLIAGDYDAAKSIYSELGDYKDSSSLIMECDYQNALSQMESGDYEAAISLLEGILDYSDAEDQLATAKTEFMYANYGDVMDALNGNTWYFNGGSDTILNSICFDDGIATISQVYFDGNGKHDNGSNDYTFSLSDDEITVTMADESELEISYSLDGAEIVLGENEYLTLEQIDEGLQGYWECTANSNEKHILIEYGSVSSEKAAQSLFDSSEYFYYGPYEGTYTLNFGGFDTDMSHGSEWFFNIIDGVVTLLNYDHVCSPSDGFPGEYGYSF